MIPTSRHFIIALLLFLALSAVSCGGGGEGSGSTAPYIFAELSSFPPGQEPAHFQNASVEVIDDNTGDWITTAIVIMNSVTLTYNATNYEYEGNVLVAPGDQITLSVNIDGKTYTASGNQFTSYPTISAPVTAATWRANLTNTITWSGGVPKTNSFYGVGILDANLPNGPLLWPTDNSFREFPASVTSYTIPQNSMSVGNSLAIVGIAKRVSISGAGLGSDFVISGFNYVPITIMDDTAMTWSVRFPGISSYLNDVVWSGTQFLAVGSDWNRSRGSFFTSPNGLTWSGPILSDKVSRFSGVAWSGTQFVAVGYNFDDHTGYIVTSSDGATWTTRNSNTTAALYRVIWSGTQFVAVGQSGTILTSPDGETWTVRTSNTSQVLNDVVWSGTQFVAVGDAGVILTSPNGITWTAQTSGILSALFGVASSGTQIVAVGSTILASPNGVNWTEQTVNIHGLALRDVTWSGTNFVTVNVGSAYVSQDGVTWVEHKLNFGVEMYSITWSGTRFLATGYHGYGTSIVTSPYL